MQFRCHASVLYSNNKEPWMPFRQGQIIKLHKDNCSSLEDGLKWSEKIRNWRGTHASVRAQSCPTLTLSTVARQAPLSLGFPRQEHWSGLTFPTPGDVQNPRIEPKSPVSPALAGRFFTAEPPGKPWRGTRSMQREMRSRGESYSQNKLNGTRGPLCDRG